MKQKPSSKRRRTSTKSILRLPDLESSNFLLHGLGMERLVLAKSSSGSTPVRWAE